MEITDNRSADGLATNTKAQLTDQIGDDVRHDRVDEHDFLAGKEIGCGNTFDCAS